MWGTCVRTGGPNYRALTRVSGPFVNDAIGGSCLEQTRKLHHLDVGQHAIKAPLGGRLLAVLHHAVDEFPVMGQSAFELSQPYRRSA